jgi:anaphase-promoting complex subunit 8
MLRCRYAFLVIFFPVSSSSSRVFFCLLKGNYYSFTGQHEQAIAQFQRALRLDARFLSACTLMGHEYIELKNLPAAVAAYRRAIGEFILLCAIFLRASQITLINTTHAVVDVSPRDYRAWYGLGQTYEILAMPLYSLYYYRQAQILRPDDTRMLSALATAYKVNAGLHKFMFNDF